MTIQLRPYQEECLKAITEAYQNGITRQLVHMATGSGKTVVFAFLAKQKNCKTLVLAHTLELLEQARDKIKMICPSLEVGLVNANSKEFDKQVVVSSIQSARQPENLRQLQAQGFELLIYDESHRAASESSEIVLGALGFGKETKRLLVGFSATPFRNDKKELGEIFEKVVYHKSIKDLVCLGFLCKPVGIKIKTDLDLSTVVTQDGDFVTTSLAEVMNTPAMRTIVVDAFIEKARNRKTICFAVNVSHALNLAEELKNRGISSEAIYGEMPIEKRKDLLERFKNGSISVLTNCQILTEGFDSPEVDCILVAKPTQSKGLYQQMCGRGLRNFPSKRDCLILDFGSKSHSLCNTAVLLDDSDTEQNEQKQSHEGKISEFAKGLPPSINKKLKASILEFDPLGDNFQWIKDGPSFSLKGIGNEILKIFPIAEDRYSVVFFTGNISKTIAENISFEYAHGAAEEFAKNNRSHFVVSDLEASWRQLPITDKQKSLFKSFGYRKGISDLSRGQAALIINSGVLNKKAPRRSRGLNLK